MSGADIIGDRMYHESDARRNVREIDEEQLREGALRELFGEFDEGSIAPVPVMRRVLGLDEVVQERFDELMNKVRVRDVTTFEDVFNGIFEEAFDLLIQRQRKYGPDNIAQQGMWGVLTRIADDKIARLRRAFNGRIAAGQIALDPVAEGESDDTFEDACLDLMNYAAILLALKRGQWGKPLADER